MEVDVKQIARALRRWWWLLLLPALISGTVAWNTARQQQPLYSSTVILRVNPPATSAADYSALQLSQNLTETYRRLIVVRPVLDRVVTDLGLPYDSSELATRTTATAVSDTQLLRLTVSDTSPAQAARIANAIASTFIASLGEQSAQQIGAAQQDLTGQVGDLQTQLNTIDAQITGLDTPANADDANVQSDLQTLRQQRSQLQSQIGSLQNQIQTLTLNVASSTTQVSISEPASPPKSPYAPRVAFYTLLGAFVGLLIAVGAVALLEYLDNTVRTSTELSQLTNSTVLSEVGLVPGLRRGANPLYVLTHPHSAPTEAMRLLRTNLDFAAAVAPITALAITSSVPGEGKSTLTANLGIVMAQAGFKVAIIDCDLRKPAQHRIFGVRNDRGLTNLLTRPDMQWGDVAQWVAVPGLMLVPSGPVPPNPSDLLSLNHFAAVIERVKAEADVVLLDSPPILAVSDPLVIATRSDGALLVTRAGVTRREALRRAVTALRQGDIRLDGVVLNQQKRRESETYDYYQTYATAPAPGGESAPPGVTRSVEPG